MANLVVFLGLFATAAILFSPRLTAATGGERVRTYEAQASREPQSVGGGCSDGHGSACRPRKLLNLGVELLC